MSRMAPTAPAIMSSFQPAELEEGEETDSSPPFKDTSWKSLSIGQNAVTWPYLAAREDGKCHSCSGWLTIQRSLVEEGEVTDTETICSHCSLRSVSDFSPRALALEKVKGCTCPVFIAPGFFILLLLPYGRSVWPLTHTFQRRGWRSPVQVPLRGLDTGAVSRVSVSLSLLCSQLRCSASHKSKRTDAADEKPHKTDEIVKANGKPQLMRHKINI